MAAPIAGKIILPTDVGNTGPKVRTQTRVIGADTVHEHFFIPTSIRKIDGIYYCQSATLTGHTTAHNVTSTGYWWFQNPVGGSTVARLRRVLVKLGNGASIGADVTTISRYGLNRFTFTGTASGAIITPAKRDSTDAANVANLRTAVTGMTITAGAIVGAIINSAYEFTTSGIGNSDGIVCELLDPTHEDEYLIVRPGEGMCFYGIDTGVAQFRIIVNVVWDEYDNA